MATFNRRLEVTTIAREAIDVIVNQDQLSFATQRVSRFTSELNNVMSMFSRAAGLTNTQLVDLQDARLPVALRRRLDNID